MTTYLNVKRVKLFLVPDQVEEEEDTVVNPWYNATVDLPLPLIDWDKWEVDDLNILSKPVEARMKEWIDG